MASLFVLIELYAISFSTFSILCIAIGFVTGIQMTLPAVVMVEFIGWYYIYIIHLCPKVLHNLHNFNFLFFILPFAQNTQTGVEQTTIGFGFSNVLSGLIALSRPLLIDYVKETTNSYDRLLIINGALCLFATFPWYLYNRNRLASASPKRDEKENNLAKESV